MDIFCLRYMGDLKLHDSIKTQTNKVWRILRNAYKALQIDYEWKMQMSSGGRGQPTPSVSGSYQLHKFHGKKCTDFLQVKYLSRQMAPHLEILFVPGITGKL